MFVCLDGPEMPTIMGPNAAKRGDNATFRCYTSSNPPCSYEWFFNGSVVSDTSEYVASLLTGESSVMYTCMAYNNITGKNITAYKMLTVYGETWTAILQFCYMLCKNRTFGTGET